MQPIDRKVLAALLKQTLAVWESNQPGNFKDVAGAYLEAYEDVPADLVETALKHVRLNSRYFPKPAELREPIRAELEARRALHRRLTTMNLLAQKQGQQAAQPARQPRSEADKQAVAEAMAKIRANLSETTIKRIPTAPGDSRAPAADPYRAAYAAMKRTGEE